VANPQCGQDLSIRAVQDAHRAGIGTSVVGVGEILGGGLNSGCSPGWPCDQVHLQDLANAGRGLPVARPDDVYLLSPCLATSSGAGMLSGEYATGDVTENAPYYVGDGAVELRAEISRALDELASCTYALDPGVVFDPESSTLELDGEALPFDGPNGYEIDASGTLTLLGTACELAHDGAELTVTVSCDAVAAP